MAGEERRGGGSWSAAPAGVIASSKNVANTT